MPQRLAAKLDSWWKIGAILGGCVALGVSGGLALASFATLPAVAESNEARIAANAERIDLLEAHVTKIQEESTDLKDALNDRLERLECLVVASRRNTPIEDCL